MPSFNQGQFIEGAIRSVLLQGYPKLEFFVLDGGSTDGTVDIIRKYESWLTEWVSARDRGQSDAINKGLSKATGEVVGWLNTDDRLLPGALIGLARHVTANPDAVAWVGQCRSVTPRGEMIYRHVPRGLTREGLADWGNAGQISQPACFFSRAAATDLGGVNESLHFVMDVDLWLRLASLGTFAASNELWAEEIIHADAKTSAQRGQSLAELHLIQLRHGFEDLALRRMAEELQVYETLRRGTVVERLKYNLNLAARPLLDRLGW